jgi:cell division GTPase FtsZ
MKRSKRRKIAREKARADASAEASSPNALADMLGIAPNGSVSVEPDVTHDNAHDEAHDAIPDNPPDVFAVATRDPAPRVAPFVAPAVAPDVAPGVTPDGAPIVIGVGAAGYRVASLVASRESRAIRTLAVLARPAPAGPRPVPTLTWPERRAGAAAAVRELLARAEGARAAVIATGLASSAAVSIAPDILSALAPRVGTLAAVGVVPFSFEGSAKADAAAEALRALAPSVSALVVAEREGARALFPPDTPVEKACAFVEEAAALAAAALARAGAEGDDLAKAFAAARGGCALGAGEATGPKAVARAARAALERSLLSERKLLTSRGAVLVLALGRTPTLGEIGEAEGILREGLPHGASVAASMVRDASLGERVLAAVFCVPASGANTDDVFPSENPMTLEVPAFMRRRSARPGGRRARLRRIA